MLTAELRIELEKNYQKKTSLVIILFFIIVITLAVLIFINVSLDVPEGFQAIIFFGGLAPVALIFHKLFFSSREDKGHLEYENYEKEWEKLLKKEKSRSGSTKIKK